MNTDRLKDLAGGVAIVATFSLTLAVYHTGLHGTPPWMPTLILAALGIGLGFIIRTGILGRTPSLTDMATDALVTGILAGTAGPIDVLTAPVQWRHLVTLAPVTAASVVLLYFGVNIGRAFARHRGWSPRSAATLVALPFLIGLLLTLNAPVLLADIGGPTLGRIVILSVFLAILAAILTLMLKQKLPSIRLLLVTMVCATTSVLASWIADFGAGSLLTQWPAPLRAIAVIVAVMLSQAGLWGMVYLMTGMVLDAIRGTAPCWKAGFNNAWSGLQRGAIYGGVFISILLAMGAVAGTSWFRLLISAHPLLVSASLGAMVFPFVKTVIETFDGSSSFFPRLRAAYSDATLWTRGLVAGFGFSWCILHNLPLGSTGARAITGFGIGAATYAGVTLLRDALLAGRGKGRPSPWRTIVMEIMLGGLIGAAIGFYLDGNQISLVLKRFAAYLSIGHAPSPTTVTPLLNKWGLITLGQVTGGANLLFYESVTGVIVWAIPAWLFALNATFMRAAFQREVGPIRNLFSRDGFRSLGENMIFVLRWGLWMAPIINTFLRPMGEPSWYNQDGAIRTVVATVQQVRLSPDDFHAWSLSLFTSLLAYDSIRILIWLDHMGLRVATLVNLSFIGVDRLESRLARRLAPWSTGRCIPEAVKRFATWAPLLIPYYIPMGADWDIAWNGYKAFEARQAPTLLTLLFRQPWHIQFCIAVATAIPIILALTLIRWRRLKHRAPDRATADLSLSNPAYEVILRHDGAIHSQSVERGYDLTRQSYDPLEPAGRILFLVDQSAAPAAIDRSWPLLGNFPGTRAPTPSLMETDDSLVILQDNNGIRAHLKISLPDPFGKTELWTLTLTNTSGRQRQLAVVPYLEWVLNRTEADRGHTQYNRLFSEMDYSVGRRTLTAWDARTGLTGFLASDTPASGYLTSRIDFIGRARSLWHARVLESLAFSPTRNTGLHPTFDPIGSLCIPLLLPADSHQTIRLALGMAESRSEAEKQILLHLKTTEDVLLKPPEASRSHPVRHGEIPSGITRPYHTSLNNGRTLRIHTPFTPRPYDHTLSNHLNQVTMVTNRGLHTTSNGNSQQNRLTPDWADTVTREAPSEAFYLFDPETHEWFSPTYHPLNDSSSNYETDFSVDGTAIFRMRKAELETELTVFVPPEAAVTVYLLTLRNHQDRPRLLRLAPFFQMCLADQPEHAAPLIIRRDEATGALLYQNHGNTFRQGPAFAVLSCPATVPEIVRTHFMGVNSDVTRPFMVEHGTAATDLSDDHHPVAAFLTEVEIPAQGEATVSFLLGQADDPLSALALIRNYSPVPMARKALELTRASWLAFADSLTVTTSRPEFDELLPWLAYQALAERIWARRGFYQTSGAYGFRDQLQDAVNLIWIDPAIARSQILLHAAQQFLEGDVVHWFHVLSGNRTGMAARTHASDNLLWLVWAVTDYIRMTGDHSILFEKTPYLEAEQPFAPLPAGKQGMGFVPLRSARVDTVYQHCLLALDRVLETRMGSHGLPLMGTGDWNDGLDSIGSEGRGESVWLGFFLDIILTGFTGIIEEQEGTDRGLRYQHHQAKLRQALEQCWREDRYLRAIHDDGTEIGIKGSGVWEIDALTAAWAVFSGLNPEHARKGFDTALSILEQDNAILLGWPSLRVDSQPYLGRSSSYPEGVRENGMYCHGVQWLVGAARILAEQASSRGEDDLSRQYRDTAWRLWDKIAPLSHTTPENIETYGGQPNKQAADLLTSFDPGRMIWHGYTGAAGWMLRQAMEGVLGLSLGNGQLHFPADWKSSRGPLIPVNVKGWAHG
ncbi:MAG: hypothetical protein WCI20_02855 [bacterium]